MALHMTVPSHAEFLDALLFGFHIANIRFYVCQSYSFCNSHYQNSNSIKLSTDFLYHFIKNTFDLYMIFMATISIAVFSDMRYEKIEILFHVLETLGVCHQEMKDRTPPHPTHTHSFTHPPKTHSLTP
jgi:hypothetical protein